MEFGVAAIEREDKTNKCVYGSSGIFIDSKYVITTGNILLSLFDESFYKNLRSVQSGDIHPLCLSKESDVLKIIWKNKKQSDDYCVKDGELFGFFVCKNIKANAKQILQGWTVDTCDNSKELETVLSMFFIIKVISSGDIPDLKSSLLKWWNLIKSRQINQLDEILIRSVPFGNRFFFNSHSRGIVSNILGINSCLIVSDCPSTPGSEGSPVYKIANTEIPCGIVISTSCWWGRDWTGLTLIADIRPILEQLVSDQQNLESKDISHSHLISNVKSCFVQVYCGSQWGTAIIINAENGILLTNSHVIDERYEIRLYWKGHSEKADLIYKIPDNEIYDLAVIKCHYIFLKSHNLRSINISKEPAFVGEEVFSVGFAIFNKNVNSNPTVSKGLINHASASMITTTCCVNSGMSGGAILNKFGYLIGIIVCNTKLEENVYPRFNMAVPYIVIESVIQKFLTTQDSSILCELLVTDPKLRSSWKLLQAKL